MVRSRLRLLAVFTIRDLQEQYAGTALGVVWALLQPILLVMVYWWVFGYVWALKVPALGAASGELPFILFLLSGLLPWLAFQDAVNKSVASITGRAEVLRQGRFPVMVFPLAKVASAHLVFAVLIMIFVVGARSEVLWHSPDVAIGLLMLYLLQFMFACGVGLILASLAVYVRDLPHLIPMGMMVLFFTAPILYPLSRVPESLTPLLWLNPYVPFVVANQYLMLGGAWPGVGVWLHASGLACGTLAAGLWLFRKLRPGFADVV